MVSRISKGQGGENAAAQYYSENGYVVAERNWRCRHKEVDLICTKGNQLVIVEVKTRSAESADQPFEAIRPAKARHLITAAQYYIDEKGINPDVRFDVVWVTESRDTYYIEVSENAINPFDEINQE